MLAPGNSPEIQIPAKVPVRWALPGTFQTKGQRCLLGAHGLSNLRPSGIWGPDHQPALGDHTGLSSSRFNIHTCLLPFLSIVHYLRTTESWGWRVRISSNHFTPSSAYSNILWFNLTETSQSQKVQPARITSDWPEFKLCSSSHQMCDLESLHLRALLSSHNNSQQ